jgi:hypothetical protein
LIVALACAFVLAASLAPAGEAATDEAPADEETVASTRVLLVTATSDTPTDASATARLRRTRAELEAAGFDVLEVGLTEPIGDVDRERLAALAQEYDARALTVLHPVRVQAEVWTIEGDAKPERRAVVVGGLVPAESDAVFALRVAEVLQATLIAVEVAQAPKPEPKATPAPPPPSPPRELAPRWGARVGAHAAGTTGDLGFMLGPTLGTTIAVGPKRRIGIDIEAFATALPGRTRSDAGRASVGFGLLRGTIGFWPLPTARVSPGVGLGWGMLVAWTRGRGTEPWSGRSDVTVVSTPVGAGDLAISITRRFRIRIGFRIGVALPAVRVQTSTTTIRTAQPLADGGIAFEIVGPGRR